MKVESSRNQENIVSQYASAQSAGQAARPAAQVAIIDMSGTDTGGTTRAVASNDSATQDPKQPENVGTSWKLGPDGEHIYLGSFPVPHAPHDASKDETPWNVFKRGFRDGATHPGQTMGKINDIATGDQKHTGENRGKKVDRALEKTPVVSDALVITRGLAGEKDADGNPQLPQPNVQPDAPGGHGKGGAPGRPVEKPSSGELSYTKPHAEPAPSKAPSKTPATGSSGAPAAPVQTKTPQPPATGTQDPRPHADEPAPNAPEASASHFDVPAQYAGKPKGNLAANPDSPGVYRDERGQNFIQQGEHNWPVRYDKDNATWRVYQPDNPAKPQYPVGLNEQGNWRVHGDVGLKGGAPEAAANGSGDMANRDRLHEATTSSPNGNTPGSYAGSVKIVNDMLKRLGIHLSDQSADSIINNLHKVDAGEIAHATASAREAWIFARDVANPNLSMRDRSAAALGVVLNGLFAPAYMTQFDLNNYHFGHDQSADLRRAMQMFLQFDPHA